MFGLGGWEIALLGLAVLVFFGPNKLPQLMRQAGKVMREVRKASFEFQHSLEREISNDPYRKAHRREKKRKEKAEALGISPDELDPAKRPADVSAPSGAPPADATAASPGSETKPKADPG